MASDVEATERIEAGTPTTCKAGLNVARSVVVALSSEASGQSSHSGASFTSVTSAVSAKSGRPGAAALSHPQTETQATNTHKRDTGRSAVTVL